MPTKYDPERYRLSHKKRTILSAFIIFIIISITIFIGIKYLNDKLYKLIGLLIIFYTMLPFFMVFEKRRPKARELVIIAVLYVSGVLYDTVHSLDTAFFMFVFGEKMISKMEKVKIKYRLYV